MNKDSCYAFYGSLRRNMFNYKKYKKHLEFLYVEKISGFRLYALRFYPFAFKTNQDSDIITVEVMRVMDKQTEQEIHNLELEAGYYYDEVIIRNNSVGIYLFDDPGKYPLVDDGDWLNFNALKK